MCRREDIALASPAGIKNHKLLVSVENPAWRFELNTRKEEIISKINTHLQKVKNKTLIKDIVFV